MPARTTTSCPIASLIVEQAEIQQQSERAGDKVGLSTPGSNWRRLAAVQATYEALSEKAAAADQLYRGLVSVREFRDRYAAADSKAVRAQALAKELAGSACR